MSPINQIHLAAALQALADTDRLLIKAASLAFLHKDTDLSDALKRQRNINMQALREARGTTP